MSNTYLSGIRAGIFFRKKCLKLSHPVNFNTFSYRFLTNRTRWDIAGALYIDSSTLQRRSIRTMNTIYQYLDHNRVFKASRACFLLNIPFYNLEGLEAPKCEVNSIKKTGRRSGWLDMNKVAA